MNNTKHFLTSKTFWGSAIVFGVTIANMLGFEVTFNTEGLADQIVIAAGAILALYGRFVANTTITLK